MVLMSGVVWTSAVPGFVTFRAHGVVANDLLRAIRVLVPFLLWILGAILADGLLLLSSVGV